MSQKLILITALVVGLSACFANALSIRGLVHPNVQFNHTESKATLAAGGSCWATAKATTYEDALKACAANGNLTLVTLPTLQALFTKNGAQFWAGLMFENPHLKGVKSVWINKARSFSGPQDAPLQCPVVALNGGLPGVQFGKCPAASDSSTMIGLCYGGHNPLLTSPWKE